MAESQEGYTISSSSNEGYTVDTSSTVEAKQISKDVLALMIEHKLDHCKKEFMELNLFELADVNSVTDDKILEGVGFGKIHKRAFWKLVEDVDKLIQDDLSARMEAAAQLMDRSITVQLPEGDIVRVAARRDDKISELKTKIEKVCPEYASAFQKLYDVCSQRPLDDNKSIVEVWPTDRSEIRIRLVKVNWASSALSGTNCQCQEYLWPPHEKLQQEFACNIISTKDDGKDAATLHSVAHVLQELEAGRLSCQGGLAVVYSVKRKQYWLLYNQERIREKQDITNEAKRRYKVHFLHSGREESRHVEYDLHDGPHNGQRQYRLNPDLPNEHRLPPYKEGVEIQARERDEFSGKGDKGQVEQWKDWIPYYIIKSTIFDAFVFASKDTADEPLPYEAPAT